MFKVIVCGDRNWSDDCAIARELKKLPKDTIIIHGGARGADNLAALVATELGLKTQEFKAQWDIYGRGAGPMRNEQMLAEGPDLVLAFHFDITQSKGTKHMINIAHNAGVKYQIFTE